MKKKSLFVSKFKKVFRFLPYVASAMPLFLSNALASGAVDVVTIANFRNNDSHALHFFVGAASNIATVCGLALLFAALLSLYGSHVKKGAGGKPAAHGLTLLGCGAILIGLPYMFVLTANTFWGHKTTTIGQDNGQMYQLYGDVIGNNY